MAIDFKSLARPIAFGRKAAPEEAGVPAPLLRKQDATRRLAMLKEAAEVLSVLPGPGEALHAIMTGRYDLADLVDALLQAKGKVDHLRIATLSFNGRNVEAMARWIDTGTVSRLTMLASQFFRANNTELFESLREKLAETPGHRLAASRNHCKVVTLAFADGSRFALEGSANLRTNSNTEQFCLFQAEDLHDWHAGWIDEQVAKHQGDGQADK